MLDTAFIIVIPLVLIALAYAFNNTILSFFGGAWAVLAGFEIGFSPEWASWIFIGLGLYHVIISVWIEAQK